MPIKRSREADVDAGFPSPKRSSPAAPTPSNTNDLELAQVAMRALNLRKTQTQILEQNRDKLTLPFNQVAILQCLAQDNQRIIDALRAALARAKSVHPVVDTDKYYDRTLMWVEH
jgi:hypothetical protein